MTRKVDGAVNILLAIAAVIVAGNLLLRMFFVPPSEAQDAPVLRTQPPIAERPSFTPSWRDALRFGVGVGDTSAPVKVVVLSDLECPYCASFEPTMTSLLLQRPKDVEMVFVQFPLARHPHALAAARAADCAAASGKFHEFVDVVYAKQDSLGQKSWGAYAREAHITDTTAIERCARATTDDPRVTAGRSFARSIGALATPTVIVNGWTFKRGAPPKDVLERLVDSIVIDHRR